MPLSNVAFDDAAEGTHWSAMCIDFSKKNIFHIDSAESANEDAASMMADIVMELNPECKFKFVQLHCFQQTVDGNNCALHTFINIDRFIKGDDLMVPLDVTQQRFKIMEWMQNGKIVPSFSQYFTLRIKF